MKTVSFTPSKSYSSKIEVIKAIRTLTGMGLVDAKNTSEGVGAQDQPVSLDIKCNDYDAEECFRIMRNNGCIVGSNVHGLLKELRVIASEALLQGHDELASEILQLVLIEKLRHAQ